MLISSFNNLIEVGCDEAGRGCLSGPVISAAVILPPDFNHHLLNDSKKMTARNRNILEKIIRKECIAFGIGESSTEEIDKINILNATFLSMHRAIDKIKSQYDLLLIDGNRFKKYKNKKHKCIIKGDEKHISIAAASVLAKTFRDKIMNDLSQEFPNYGWSNNKGYPTKHHKEAIKNYGTNIWHRKSFKLQ